MNPGDYCKSVNCPWYDDRCTSPNDHTKKPNGKIECDYDRGIFPFKCSEDNEAVPVVQREVMHMLVWCCGSCGVAITDGDRFCRMCGKKVKWDA